MLYEVDREGEYVDPFASFVRNIELDTSSLLPIHPQQNGIAEKENRYLERNGYSHSCFMDCIMTESAVIEGTVMQRISDIKDLDD
ncbi:hypothetical protein Tco_0064061 [Tanacetum coccineum]